MRWGTGEAGFKTDPDYWHGLLRGLIDEVAQKSSQHALPLISYQSGQVHKGYMRRHCNKNLRQAVQLFADKSRA